MLPICDVPFLAHQLAHLKSHGVTSVTFACGFLPQPIIAHFGDGSKFGLDLQYVVEPEPLGTGGAIGFAARTVDASRVLVCNGDVLTGMNIGELLSFHEKSGATATIALTPVEDPSRYGLVRTTSAGAVTEFLEKPSPDQIDTNLINAGTYILERAALDRIPSTGACSIERDIFPALVDHGLYALGSDEYWNDIGTVASYLQANADMLCGRVAGAGAFSGDRKMRSVVDSAATVSAGAMIHAPVWIGPGAEIEDGATIGPGSVIGPGTLVEAGGRVVRSVVLEHVVVGREAQVVDSIVGERAQIAPRVSVSDGAVVAPSADIVRMVVRGADARAAVAG
jgi:mannose-1-phosphate guanylyltransferase